jgi:predicted DCC family thiol-disulfide oxidoreductase YuxK/GNAT superfamily N-acetyltransferase
MGGVFLYDGECGLCEKSARWLERHATSPARIEAWQQADLAVLGLRPEDCAEAVQWVEDGRRAVGPDAVAAYLQTSTNSWQTASRVLTAPVSKRVTWPVYRWVAHHRDQLPVKAAPHELPPAALTIKGLRRRRARDLPACARLLRVVFTEGQYPVHWPDGPRAWLGDSAVIDAWVVERQGEILGHVAISKVGLDPLSALRWREVTGFAPTGLAAVSRLFVRPRVRGQGIGSALLDVAVAEIRTRRLLPVLEVVGTSTDAIRLVEDRGWRLRAMYPWEEQVDQLHVYYYSLPREPSGS